MSDTPEEGGLGLVNIRAMITAGGAALARLILNIEQIPERYRAGWGSMVERIGRPIPSESHSKVLYVQECRRGEETIIEREWRVNVWPGVKAWPLFLRDVVWRMFFRIVPCSEWMFRHFRDPTLSLCPGCQMMVVWGPTHILRCDKWWRGKEGERPQLHLVRGWEKAVSDWVKSNPSPLERKGFVRVGVEACNWGDGKKRGRSKEVHPPKKTKYVKRRAQGVSREQRHPATQERDRDGKELLKGDFQEVRPPAGATAKLFRAPLQAILATLRRGGTGCQ